MNTPITRLTRSTLRSTRGKVLAVGVAVAAVATPVALAVPDASAASKTGTVNTNGTGLPLSVRSKASTSGSVIKQLADGSKVTITCYVRGETVQGVWGATNLWNKVSGGGYISDGFLYTGSDDPVVPKCGSGDTPAPATYIRPVKSGEVTQGPGKPYSHNDIYNKYAYDFAVPTGTNVYASRGGKVVAAGPFVNPANGIEVMVDHGGGVCSQYLHLSKVKVAKGDTVKQNQVVALSGNTGNSSGPHLHFGLVDCNTRYSKPLPVKF